MESKTNISRCAWNSLMAWPDWPWPRIFYDRSIRHCELLQMRQMRAETRTQRMELEARAQSAEEARCQAVEQLSEMTRKHQRTVAKQVIILIRSLDVFGHGVVTRGTSRARLLFFSCPLLQRHWSGPSTFFFLLTLFQLPQGSNAPASVCPSVCLLTGLLKSYYDQIVWT